MSKEVSINAGRYFLKTKTMKTYWKIILVVLSVFLCPAEKCQKGVEGEYKLSPGQYMYYETDNNYTLRQIDSVCVVEGIPEDFNGWIEASPIIREDGRPLYQKVFIPNDSTVFIVTDLDSLYNFKKRVVRTIN